MMLWQLPFFPVCTRDVFLSHCREDRTRLVVPLDRALRSEGIIPWFDRHDYPYGRTSFSALRDGILQSRHVVFLITQNMLAQPRGWTNLELAWTTLLQENLQEPGGVLQNVMLPLIFVTSKDKHLPRSIWQTIQDRAVFHQPKDGNRVAWAERQIRAFLEREMLQERNVTAWLREDLAFRHRLQARPGLIDRLTARLPTLEPPG